MIDTGARYNGTQLPRSITLYADIAAADVLRPGMILCYDVEDATAANRYKYLAKPSLNNYNNVAGFVSGPGRTGPGPVDITPFDGSIARGVALYTDENIADGEILGVIPGEYVVGKWVVGAPIGIAAEAADRSTTAGTVTATFGPVASLLSPGDTAKKCVRFFTHFTAEGATISAPAVANAVADAGTFLLTGTSSAAAFIDSLTTSETGAANLKANGILRLTPNTTNEASLTLNGEPFTLAEGCSLFFRVRFAQSNILADSQVMIGFSPADTAPIGSLNADYLAFITATAAVNLDYVKDGTGGKVSVSTGQTQVADTFVEMCVLVRHRKAATGGLDIHIWRNGTEVSTPTETQAEVPDDESLTFFIASVAGTTACTVSIDFAEINNYHGGL